MRLDALVVLCSALAGCASTLSTLQTAVPVRPRHVQVTGGYGVYLPLGPADTEGGVMTPSYDLAIGFGGSKYFFLSPVITVLEYVQMGNFSRWDMEVPAYFSIEWGQILKFWVAPKYVYSRTTFDEKLVNVSDAATALTGYDLSLPSAVNTHFFGASVGFGAGYKYVHLLLELTAGYTYCRPTLLGQQRNLGGLTLYPAVGLNVKI